MSGSLNLDGWDFVIDGILDAVDEGVRQTAEQVQVDAVKRAPIRHAFKTRKKFATTSDLASLRMKTKGGTFTGEELMEAAALLNIPIDPSQLAVVSRNRRNINSASSSAGMKDRRNLRILRDKYGGRKAGVVSSSNPRGRAFNYGKSTALRLTSRARYDIKRGRGVILIGHGKFQYGGFLKKNIVVVENTDGDRVTYSVVSKASYSRYVEFPTSRTKAQPFLLPAFKGARTALASNIRNRT